MIRSGPALPLSPRRKAMNESKRIATVAAELLATTPQEGSGQ